MAFALSIFATAYFLVLRPDGIAPYRGALAGVATTLLRTEGIAWSLLIALLGIVTLLGTLFVGARIAAGSAKR